MSALIPLSLSTVTPRFDAPSWLTIPRTRVLRPTPRKHPALPPLGDFSFRKFISLSRHVVAGHGFFLRSSHCTSCQWYEGRTSNATHQATEALADDSKSIPPRWPRTGRRRRRRLVRKVSWGVGQKRPSAQPHCSQERGARDKRGANSADRVRSVTNCHHHCTASCQVQRKQPSDQRSTAHTSDGKKGGKIPPFGQRVGG